MPCERRWAYIDGQIASLALNWSLASFQVFDSLQDLSRLCETLLVEALPRWSGARPFEPSCKLLASLLNKRADSTCLGCLCSQLYLRADPGRSFRPAGLRRRHLASFLGRTDRHRHGRFQLTESSIDCLGLGRLRASQIQCSGNSTDSQMVCYSQSMRGLIVRSDNRAYDGVAKLVSLFADEGLSKAAARTMAILSKDNDAVLIKENGAVIRVGPGLYCPDAHGGDN